jgi:hypothetical protein
MVFIISASSAIAGNVTVFEDGTPEHLAKFGAPSYSDMVNITLPAECRILNATMKVSSVSPDAGSPESPENVSVLLNGTILWEFKGTDYGGFGKQEAFANKMVKWNTQFGAAGGSNGTTVRIPKSATVQNATVEIDCSGRWAGLAQMASYTGEAANDNYGTAVSGAADVNGDGYDDVLVGAFTNSAGAFNAGRVYIYYGGAVTNATADVVMTGGANNDHLGCSLDAAGDVNGDGYDDVIAGADYAGTDHEGRAYIYYGGAGMDNIADVTLAGAVNQDSFGSSVSGAGDVNGDGYDDVLVGAPYNRAGGNDAGRAYIYYGGPGMDAIADVVLTGAAAEEHFGFSVAGAGDVDGDGYGDVMVGAYGNKAHGDYTGRAYLFLGGASMDSAADVTFTGAAWNDYFGMVAGAGDVNGDGYDDVVVGAAGNDAGGIDAGRAYIYFGGSGLDSASDVTLTGAAASNYFGATVSGAGDVDGDGYDDVIVGAYMNGDGGTGAGKAYIYYGGANMDSTADLTFIGSAGEYLGSPVSGAGDINGDGRPGVVIGTSGNTAYLYESIFGLREAGVSVGQAKLWSNSSYFNGTAVPRDFAQILNNYISSNGASGSDSSGNAYLDVNFGVSGKNQGSITLRRLNITYRCTLTVPDFSGKLNSYIAAHGSEKDADGNLTVPFKVMSRTIGKIKLLGLNITTDVAPVLVRRIPDAGIDEDTKVPDLVDLYDYFEDDHDAKQQLRFSLASASNSSIVNVEIVDNRFLSVDAAGGDLNDNWTGVLEMAVKAADHRGLARGSNTFNVTVRNVLDPPVITSLPSLSGNAGRQYHYQVIAVDGDNDTLAYDLPKKPQNMTIDSRSGLVAWVISAGGEYDVSVSVTDGRFTAVQDFKLTVPDRPPRITNTTVPEACTGVPFLYDIPAVDDDGDRLSFSILGGVPGMSCDPSTGRISWTPTQPGNQSVSVAVSDGSLTMIYDFAINVLQGNRPPKFQSSPGASGMVGFPYSYNASATDPDGDALSFSVGDLPTGMTFDNATGKVSWTPGAPGNFTIMLKVIDGKGGEALQEFILRIAGPVRPRIEIVRPWEGETVKGMITVSGLAIKGTWDVVSVQIKIDSGEWTNLSLASNWQYTLDTTKLNNGEHTIQARARDGIGYSEMASRTITVNNPKAAAKGFIPGFSGMLLLLAISSATSLLMRRIRT